MRMVIEILEVSAGAYRARCPALPGCAVVGSSAEDARSKMADAVGGYLASFDSAGPEYVEIEVAASTAHAPGKRNAYQESHAG